MHLLRKYLIGSLFQPSFYLLLSVQLSRFSWFSRWRMTSCDILEWLHVIFWNDFMWYFVHFETVYYLVLRNNIIIIIIIWFSALNYLWFWDINRSPNLDQKTRPSDNSRTHANTDKNKFAVYWILWNWGALMSFGLLWWSPALAGVKNL